MQHLLKFALSLLLLTSPATAGNVSKGITYSTSNQQLDLCQPFGMSRNTGVIFIHGGGFSKGHRNAMLGFCKLLAGGGFPSVTVSYRLTSDGHSFPKALTDVREAVSWMRTNADRLGIDPDKIVLVGYSAGGTLAMNVGMKDEPGIAGIVSVAGISDFASLRATTPYEDLQSDIDAYIGTSDFATPSPIENVASNGPPTVLFHGTNDKVVPLSQAVAIADAMKSEGIDVHLRTFDDAGHEIMQPNKHLQTLLREMTTFLVDIDQG